MAVGRISGPLLKANLIRNGIDLAFETDLLYLDVNNQRVGIKTATPQYELDVTGSIKSTRFIADVSANIGDIELIGNTIRTNQPYLRLGTLDNVVYQNKARIDSIDIEGNVISTNDSNANLELRPNGTGTVEVAADMNVDGNIHATGNISADGNITLGDADTDSITFNAEIASNIIPDQDNLYSLGGNPAAGGKSWSDVWTQNFNASVITADQAIIDGVDITARQGSIFYVAENGIDTNSGTHQNDTFATIKHALSQASSGDTVYVYPGTYTEEFPLTIPVGVSLHGTSIRGTTIQPTTDTRYNDAILLNGECTVSDLTIKGFYSGGNYFEVTALPANNQLTFNVGTAPFAHSYVSGGTFEVGQSTQANITAATYDHTTGNLTITIDAVHDSFIGNKHFLKGLIFSCNGGNRTFPDNGYAFRFATDFEVTTRSPYIKNVTVITQGSTTTAEDPRGFNAGDAGKGPYVDGAYATANSKEASMLFHSATFITPGVDGLSATNGARIEWLNSFTYFANRSVHAFDSNDGIAGNGKTRIRLSGITGTFGAGETVTFTSTDSSTVIAKTIESVDNDILVIDGKDVDLVDFDTTPQSISSSGGATATTIENIDLQDFGAEIRMIGSASVYGNYGLYGNGPGVIVYAIGQNLAYIGNGKEVTNDPGTVIQENEVVQLDDAKIRFNSVDHKGDFRVGNLFYVNQEDGTASFVASNLNINITNGVTFNTDGNTTFVNGNQVRTGNVRISEQTIDTISGNLILDSATNIVNVPNDVNITGNLDVTGDVSIGGNITIGDETTDSLNIVAGIDSNLIPATTETYNLGSATKVWNNLYVNRVVVDDLEINDNYIQTTVSNANLDLRANGTGDVYIPNNDLTVDNNLIINGSSTLGDTTINGDITHTGNINQTGDLSVTGNLTVSQQITVNGTANFEGLKIEDNFITSTQSNADLELRANGTGNIIIPNNDLNVTQNISVGGDITASNITATGTLSANQYTVGDIRIDGNAIRTIVSNADLELRANGTGSVTFEGFDFESNVISTSTGDITFNPGSEFVNFDSTGAIKVPVGDTSQRPADAIGLIRYNSELNRYEGYNGTNWIDLKGVVDLDGDTKITAELTEGADDDIIRFDVSGSTVFDMDATRLNAPKIIVDDITVDGNVISSSTDTDLLFTANGTGSVLFDNFAIKDNTWTNTVSNSITLFESTGEGYVKFDGTYGIVIPVGDSLNRPDPAFVETGMMRWNTADSRVEVYDGTVWTSVAGSGSGISANDAENLAITMAIIFG